MCGGGQGIGFGFGRVQASMRGIGSGWIGRRRVVRRPLPRLLSTVSGLGRHPSLHRARCSSCLSARSAPTAKTPVTRRVDAAGNVGEWPSTAQSLYRCGRGDRRIAVTHRSAHAPDAPKLGALRVGLSEARTREPIGATEPVRSVHPGLPAAIRAAATEPVRCRRLRVPSRQVPGGQERYVPEVRRVRRRPAAGFAASLPGSRRGVGGSPADSGGVPPTAMPRACPARDSTPSADPLPLRRAPEHAQEPRCPACVDPDT